MVSHSESHATGSAGCTRDTSLMAVLSSGARLCLLTYSIGGRGGGGRAARQVASA